MFFRIFKGVLVLLALGSGLARTNASDTLLEKQKIILVVSVLDSVAFTENDIESLRRYIKKTLPEHKIIHVNSHASSVFSGFPNKNEIERVREDLHDQMKQKISDNHEITHLFIMDHGNTIGRGNSSKTRFRFMSTIGISGISYVFKEIFKPTVGKYSDNAFVMLESCLTMCGSLSDSQKRAKTLMDYLGIKNGTLFGSYQSMISVGYELGFYLKSGNGIIKNPIMISTGLFLSLIPQVMSLADGHGFDVLEYLAMFSTFEIGSVTMVKIFNYISKNSPNLNWGYLFKMKNSEVEKVFDINPYKNKHELLLKRDPQKVKNILNTCNLLFH